jgi:hypothetical protein
MSARSESPVCDELEGSVPSTWQLRPASQDRHEFGFPPGVALGSGLGLLSGPQRPVDGEYLDIDHIGFTLDPHAPEVGVIQDIECRQYGQGLLERDPANRVDASHSSP